MFIYNITSKIDNGIVTEWIQWQEDVYIPGVMATGFFYDHRFFKLLEQDESEGQSFVLQFFAKIRKYYDHYIQHYATGFHNKVLRKWGDRFIAFSTLLQAV